MKLIVLLLWAFGFIVSVRCEDFESLRITPLIGESKIKEIVKGIAGRLCYGVPSMGIPKLEPFEHLDPINVKLNHPMAELNGSISNIHLAGISGLELIDVSLTVSLKFSFEIKIPKIEASGKFKLKGSLAGLFPIDGDGSFDTTFSGVKVVASGRLTSIENKLNLVDVKAQPSINHLRANIVNLVPDKHINKVINKVLNTRGPELLQKMWHKAGDDILRKIVELLNPLRIDAIELLNILTGAKPAFKPEDPPADCAPVIF